MVPALDNFYNQATDAYEQACLRFVHTMINYVRPTFYFFFFLSLLHLVRKHKMCNQPNKSKKQKKNVYNLNEEL